MAGEVEADGVELLGETLHRLPGLDGGQGGRGGGGALLAEQADLLALAVLRGGVGGAEHQIDGGQHLRTVGIETIEGAGAGQVFEGALVDDARIDAAGEIEQVAEGAALAANLDQMLHRLTADILDGGERVEDFAIGNAEHRLRTVDAGRAYLDAETLGLLLEGAELVGVAKIEAHRGGEELDRVIGFQPCGLIGDDRVAGRMRLVEAVAGELVDEVENEFGLFRRDAALDCAGNETGALRVHLGLDLLAHRAAQ